jgi:hypothetical protein
LKAASIREFANFSLAAFGGIGWLTVRRRRLTTLIADAAARLEIIRRLVAVFARGGGRSRNRRLVVTRPKRLR